MGSTVQYRDAQITAYLSKNAKYFNVEDKEYLRSILANCDQQRFEKAILTPLKDPDSMSIISFLLGIAGVDRFMLSDKFYGFVKLFTFGGLLILWWSDFKNSKRLTQLYNAKSVINIAAPGAVKEQSNKQKFGELTGMTKKIVNDPTIKSSFKELKKSAKSFHDDMYIR